MFHELLMTPSAATLLALDKPESISNGHAQLPTGSNAHSIYGTAAAIMIAEHEVFLHKGPIGWGCKNGFPKDCVTPNATLLSCKGFVS